MKKRFFFSILLLSSLTFKLFAQEKPPVKFGKVSADDFKRSVYAIDSNASAVIIADVGYTDIVGNSKNSFSLEFQKYMRAHILNKNGYDVANVVIPIYTSGNNEEELLGLKAITYNLENGKVVETKLDVKSNVFKDKLDKRRTLRKFTFPNVKEGSIIEFQYTLKSDFIFNLQPWEFQDEYPKLWSEYNVRMPEFLYYVTLSQGYQSYYIKDQKTANATFNVSDNRGAGATERDNFNASVTDYRWVMKDVPALKEESFTSTIDNHIAKIEFQLAETRFPLTPRNVMGSWTQTCDELLKDEDFGLTLKKDNSWLNDVMDAAVGKASTDMEKARNIYTYVRNSMTCTNYNRVSMEQSLKTLLKNRNGSEAEINLLLVAMLRKAGIEADPVILSTRGHGYTYAMYPLLDRFNYVIAQVTIGKHTFYLDASESQMGFGKLPFKCYNGHARVVNPEATPIDFTADSLLERKVTSFFIINDEKGNLSGSAQKVPGYYESYRLRSQVREKGKGNLENELKKGFGNETEISDLAIDSMEKYDDPINIKFNFEIKAEKEDILYINPMFGEGYKENPFKSADRFYPVEMPYTIDETYLLQLEVPKGYAVDEIPKQLVLRLNENDDGIFEYRISESNGTVSLRSRLRIKRTNFLPEEYEMLRAFFNLVVKKHNEQIVFKKKS